MVINVHLDNKFCSVRKKPIVLLTLFTLLRCLSNVKGATKLYLTHYVRVVIILFNMVLYKSVISTYSFAKLLFLCFCVSRNHSF